jgi:putative ABC transport system ATP-binding protein
VLHQLDLTVAAGEHVAIVGRSGSGKSTLLNLIAGIDRPDAGCIEIAGERVDGLDERRRTLLRRRRIGFVFQFFNLVPTLTVGENLRLPLQLNGLADAAGEARLQGLLEAVGLADYGERFPETLSGGEQQRVALARALVHQPDLILADEPTGNLDAATGAKVWALLRGLTQSRGATLLLVTHNAEQAAQADRALQLQDGRLQPA